MADTKVDKSLDDIIKERKINVRGGQRGGRGGGGANRRGGGGNRGAGGNSNGAAGNRFRAFARRPNTGGIFKRRSGGGAANTSISPNKAASASMNGWTHDLYQNGSVLNNPTLRRNAAAILPSGGAGPAKLVISNLDFGVNDADIKGLFQEFGNIRKAAVHYDRSGRSLGTADVVFERKQDAIRALKKYNGVSLDGRPMDIQLTATLTQATQRIGGGSGGGGVMQSRGGARGGGFRRGGRGGGGGAAGPNRKQNQPAKSAADLDADLDAYNAKMQTD